MTENSEQQNIQTFRQLQELVMGAYGAGNYTQALAWLDRYEQQFPDSKVYYRNWRMCMYALMGEKDQALQTFRQAVAEGLWWSPELLLNDGDLVSLYEEPEFQELVSACDLCFETAQTESKPVRLILEPEGTQPSQTLPLILVMHGHAGSAHQFEDRWHTTPKLGWRVAMLGSSQVIGFGHFAWDDHNLALSEVRQHLEELSQKYSTDPERILLAGFSQSGWLVANWVLQGLLPITRFLALCPASGVETDTAEWISSPNIQQTRGTIIAGENDVRWVGHARRLADFMQEHGVPHQVSIIPGLGHDLPSDFETCLPSLLRFLTD